MNKSDFKDSITFLWVAVLFFLVTIDVVFPFVMFMIKALFYVIGVLLGALGICTMIKSFIQKNKNESNI